MDDYRVLRKLGSGAQGTVSVVSHKSSGVEYVMKTIDCSELTSKERKMVQQEVELLRKLHHPYIVAFKEAKYDSARKRMYIVMEFCRGGDLYSRVKKARQTGRSIPEEQVLQWLVECVLALDYLHNQRILHRDLKSQNIFLTEDGHIKLGDLGIARVLSQTNDLAKTAIGTPLYMSPEVCKNRPYSYKSDIWAVGCVLYELCTGKPAFDANNLNGLVLKIVKGKYAPPPAQYCPAIRTMVKKMLDIDPSKRPRCMNLLKSRTLKEEVRKLVSTNHTEVHSALTSGQELVFDEQRGVDGGRRDRIAQANLLEQVRASDAYADVATSEPKDSGPEQKPVQSGIEAVQGAAIQPSTHEQRRLLSELERERHDRERLRDQLAILKGSPEGPKSVSSRGVPNYPSPGMREERASRAQQLQSHAVNNIAAMREFEAIRDQRLELESKIAKLQEEIQREKVKRAVRHPVVQSSSRSSAAGTERKRGPNRPAVHRNLPDAFSARRGSADRVVPSQASSAARRASSSQLSSGAASTNSAASPGMGAGSSSTPDVTAMAPRERVLFLKEQRRKEEEERKKRLLLEARQENFADRQRLAGMQKRMYEPSAGAARQARSDAAAHAGAGASSDRSHDARRIGHLPPRGSDAQLVPEAGDGGGDSEFSVQFSRPADFRREENAHHDLMRLDVDGGNDADANYIRSMEMYEKELRDGDARLASLRLSIDADSGSSCGEDMGDEAEDEDDAINADIVVGGGLQQRVAFMRKQCVDGLGVDAFNQLYAYLQTVVDEDDDEQVRSQVANIVGEERVQFWPIVDSIIFCEQGFR